MLFSSHNLFYLCAVIGAIGCVGSIIAALECESIPTKNALIVGAVFGMIALFGGCSCANEIKEQTVAARKVLAGLINSHEQAVVTGIHTWRSSSTDFGFRMGQKGFYAGISPVDGSETAMTALFALHPNAPITVSLDGDRMTISTTVCNRGVVTFPAKLETLAVKGDAAFIDIVGMTVSDTDVRSFVKNNNKIVVAP